MVRLKSDPSWSSKTDNSASLDIDRFFRREYGRVLAALIRALGDVDLAEESAADAMAKAVELWPVSGVPANPAGWVYVAARRRAIDVIRRGSRWTHPGGADALGGVETADPVNRSIENGSMQIPDERLRLLFMCCHPALNPDAQVALTLRMVAGLTTAEIARAFLLSETTLAQRLVRAKRKIRDAGIPFEVPESRHMPDRLAAVLGAVYLVFNEGYFTGEAEGILREDLCAEAIRLSHLLTELLPEEPEAVGLHALLLLQHSRRDARVSPGGELILLEDQDRSLWHHDEIDRGRAMVESSLRRKRVGPYQVQAAIAALHAEALTTTETDWPQISALYSVLLRMTSSPVVELNRAVAIAMAEGPARGLEVMDAADLAERLSGYRWYHTTRARLLEKLGRNEEAVASYSAALDLITNESERVYVQDRIQKLRDRGIMSPA